MPERSGRERLIVALDFSELTDALELVDLLGQQISFYKVGLTLFASAGRLAVDALAARQKHVFLDMKLHDIPAQVAGAVGAIGRMGVRLATVHTAGGLAMLEAAAGAAPPSLRLLGVTVLTSQPARPEVVLERAQLAAAAGLPGVVASAREAGRLRTLLGSETLIVTPGIRLKGDDRDDQERVATPADARDADFLVVGRPVTQAQDPRQAVEALSAGLLP